MSVAGKATANAAEAGAKAGAGAIETFVQLFKDFNVVGFVLGLLIANGVAEVAQAFIDGVIMPTAQPYLDRINAKGAGLRIGSFTVHMEKFLKAWFKFMMLCLCIFILVTIGVKMTKPVTWVRVVGQDLKANLM